MDELDPGAKRRLLGDLRQLRSLLDDLDTDDDATADADAHATSADDATWDVVTPTERATPGLSAGTLGAQLPEHLRFPTDAALTDSDGTHGNVEPPVLDDIVDPVPADFDAAASEDTDWNQFVDQVFAQTSGVAPGFATAGGLPAMPSVSTGGSTTSEDALLAELTQRLDARLATLRAAMLAELEAMLARRSRFR